MAGIEPDSVMGRPVEPDADEPVLAEFRADRLVYWRSHLVMAVVLGTAAGLVLLWQGNPWPVAGPLGRGAGDRGAGGLSWRPRRWPMSGG
jgi:hypothetical protein